MRNTAYTSYEVETDVRPMQGTPKKTNKVKFDWLPATAEALILFHGCKISNIVIEIICKKYIN